MADKRAIDEAILKVTRRVNNTPQVELELTGVIRDNNDLRKQRDLLNSDLAKAKLAENLEARTVQSQFQIQDTANLPTEAEKPNKWAVLGIGSLISLALAIGFAFIVDLARQRVWTQSEIESFWGVPVMVDIPAIVSDGDQAVLRKKRLTFATLFLAGFAVYGVFLYGVYLNNTSILRQLDPVLQTLVYR
jgi:capsular polysaccharide biosynthesis protein